MILIIVVLITHHKLLHVFGVVGDALLAEEAAAVLSNKKVVFDAHTAEVLVGLQLVEVQEFGTMA